MSGSGYDDKFRARDAVCDATRLPGRKWLVLLADDNESWCPDLAQTTHEVVASGHGVDS